MADRLDISPSCVSLWESGDRAVPLKFLVPLCAMYEVEPNEILGVDEMANPETTVSVKVPEGMTLMDLEIFVRQLREHGALGGEQIRAEIKVSGRLKGLRASVEQPVQHSKIPEQRDA